MCLTHESPEQSPQTCTHTPTHNALLLCWWLSLTAAQLLTKLIRTLLLCRSIQHRERASSVYQESTAVVTPELAPLAHLVPIRCPHHIVGAPCVVKQVEVEALVCLRWPSNVWQHLRLSKRHQSSVHWSHLQHLPLTGGTRQLQSCIGECVQIEGAIRHLHICTHFGWFCFAMLWKKYKTHGCLVDVSGIQFKSS